MTLYEIRFRRKIGGSVIIAIYNATDGELIGRTELTSRVNPDAPFDIGELPFDIELEGA